MEETFYRSSSYENVLQDGKSNGSEAHQLFPGLPKADSKIKEREENVKIDIFNAFIELLRQTGNVRKGGEYSTNSSCLIFSPFWMLKQEVPKLVSSLNRQLREKSVKTKIGVFSVLKQLVVVLPECLAEHIGSLVPGIEKALNMEVRAKEGKEVDIHMVCSAKPGLLLSTIRALDGLGVDVKQAVIICLNGFALDVFQAEGSESRIIILSLVRSNEEGKIEFLAKRNRLCMAMSRARGALYVCANILTFTIKIGENLVWHLSYISSVICRRNWSWISGGFILLDILFLWFLLPINTDIVSLIIF